VAYQRAAAGPVSRAVPGSTGREDWLALALAALVFLFRLGAAPLFDFDEGAFSEATREMLAKGDFLSTWLNGRPRFDKPILIYWLQAIPVALFGPHEWTFRLPSALATTGWCFAVYRFARERLDAPSGWMALLVAMTSLGVQFIGRAATADALLNFLLVMTLFDLWRWLDGDAGRLRRAAVWAALGVLTKGPIALLIPGAALFLWCASYRDWKTLARAATDWRAWVILVAIAAPWYVAALAIHGRAFIDGFILKHNVSRFTGTLEGHGGRLYYYVLVVPLLLLPWWAWLASALAHLREAVREPLPRFLWLWAGFVVIFFSFAGTKLPHYALYGCAPLWLLMAMRREAIRSRLLASLPALLLLVFFAALPWLLSRISVKDAFYAAQLARLDAVLPAWYLPAAAAACVLGALLPFVWRTAAWRVTAALGLGYIAVFGLLVAPLLGELLQGPVKHAALFARAAGGTVVQARAHWPSFSVYLGQETPLRNPAPGELAVTRVDELQNFPGANVVFREGGVVLFRAQ
jgi:4-amino-4-deoxy-L-arabinose transferase-like glycosyltransferase